MKEKIQQVIAWIIVIISVVFGIWITPYALEWWKVLMGLD
jgi:hypothetical protein